MARQRRTNFIGQPNKALARTIQELLDLDTLKEATIILRAVRDSMKQALLRGEPVHVKGFGIFKVVERTHRPTPNNIIARDSNGPVAYSPELLYYKPRRVVIFQTSMPLQAMLNVATPNYKERRTLHRWSNAATTSNS